VTLDLSSFANALAQLEKSLVYWASELARQDPEIGRLRERSGAP
jgi:hypothetical protein